MAMESNPSVAEALKQLQEQWRMEAGRVLYRRSERAIYEECADELLPHIQRVQELEQHLEAAYDERGIETATLEARVQELEEETEKHAMSYLNGLDEIAALRQR